MKRLIIIALVAAGGLLAGAAAADASLDAVFERGNQAYLRGDFTGAIDAYESLLAAGINHEDLHYHLANAYVRADRLGPAILHYELAVELDPSRDDARTNLQLVRDAAAARFQDKLQGSDKDPLWMRVLANYTPSGLTLLFLAIYVTMFALAIAAWLLPSGFLRVALVTMLVFAIAASVGTGALLGGRWWLANRVEQAIVLPDELAIKEGPDASVQTSFLIHAGMKLRMVEHDRDWVRIRLANGLEGWTRERDLGRL